MSWDNYGAWSLDHITPCNKFDLSIEKSRLECFNYTNLQPLWWKDNLDKRRIDYQVNKFIFDVKI